MWTWKSVVVCGKSDVEQPLLLSRSKTIIYVITHHAFYLSDQYWRQLASRCAISLYISWLSRMSLRAYVLTQTDDVGGNTYTICFLIECSRRQYQWYWTMVSHLSSTRAHKGTNIYTVRREGLVPGILGDNHDVFPKSVNSQVHYDLNRYRVHSIHRIDHILLIIPLQLQMVIFSRFHCSYQHLTWISSIYTTIYSSRINLYVFIFLYYIM